MNIEVFPSKRYFNKDFFKDSQVKLQILHMDSSLEYPLHSHDFFELVFVYSGYSRHIYEDRQDSLSAGDFLFIPIGKKHSYFKNRNFSYVNVIFSDDYLEDIIIDPNTFIYTHFTDYDLSRVMKMINSIDREIYRKELGYTYNVKALLIFLLVYVCRVFHKADMISHQDTGMRIRSVVEIISKNLSKSYSLHELAEMANMSPRNFSRVFKKIYNTSAFRYINHARIKESLVLISHTDMTITQIASLVGFDDSSYYSIIFKKIMNESPSEYRRRCK